MKKRHTKNWFRRRIGKVVYRLPLNPDYGHECGCAMCSGDNVKINKGVKGNKYLHADYLWLCQEDEGIEYSDKPTKVDKI